MKRLLPIILPLFLCACLHAAEPKLTIWPAFRTTVKAGTVYPMIVQLTTSDTVRGELIVKVNERGFTQHVQSVDVGKGKFRYEIPFMIACPTSEGSLQFTAEIRNKGKLLSRSVALPVNVDYSLAFTGWDNMYPIWNLRVGWLSSQKAPDDIKPELDNTGRNYTSLLNADFVTMDRKTLPQDWRMFAMFNMIVVAEGGADHFTYGQIAALSKWVNSGGLLVLGRHTVSKDYRNKVWEKYEQRLYRERTEGRDFVSQGLGCVIFAGDAAARLRHKDAAERTKRFKGLFTCFPEGSREQLEAPYYSEGFSNYGRRNQAGVRTDLESWSTILEAWNQLALISRRAILIFGVTFLVLVTVLERLILRIIKRRHWTWVTTPVLITLFCIAASQISLATRGFRARHSSIAMHDYGINGTGLHTTINCVQPPSSKAISMSAPSSALAVRVAAESDAPASRWVADKGVLSAANPAWTAMPLVSCAAHDEAPAFEAELAVNESGQIAGTISPRKGVPKPFAVLLYLGNRFLACQKEGDTWKVVNLETWDDGVNSILSRGRFTWKRGSTYYLDYRGEYFNSISWAVTPQIGGVFRTYGSPMCPPIPPRLLGQAVIVAFAHDGPGLDATDPAARKKLHVYRQRVQIAGWAPKVGEAASPWQNRRGHY